MSESRGPWTIHTQQIAYDNPWMSVREFDVTRPDGEPGLYGVVEPKNLAIGVLPIFENGDTLLVGQYRFALDAYSWELPEGGGPLSDQPLVSAQRELTEETGYSARCWDHFGSYDMSNSITNERAEMFLAWDLTLGKAEREGSEADMIVKRVALRDALDMTLTGKIRDAFTALMLHKAVLLAQRGALDPKATKLIVDAMEL